LFLPNTTAIPSPTQHNTTQHNTTQHNTTQQTTSQLRPSALFNSINTFIPIFGLSRNLCNHPSKSIHQDEVRNDALRWRFRRLWSCPRPLRLWCKSFDLPSTLILLAHALLGSGAFANLQSICDALPAVANNIDQNTCISNMLALAPSLGCPTANATCLCSNTDFGYGIRDCANEACGSEAAAIIAYGVSYCASMFDDLGN
jgi:hypothetical protein